MDKEQLKQLTEEDKRRLESFLAARVPEGDELTYWPNTEYGKKLAHDEIIPITESRKTSDGQTIHTWFKTLTPGVEFYRREFLNLGSDGQRRWVTAEQKYIRTATPTPTR